MANENVEFSRGQSSDIPPNKVPGRFLIETDTGAMYLDDSTYNRIQIKDPTKISNLINSDQGLDITFNDDDPNALNINLVINQDSENALYLSPDTGLYVCEVLVGPDTPPLSSKNKLWIDTSEDSASTPETDADTLNGQTGDYYNNLSNANGILSLAKGGTGVSSLSALKSLLGIPNFSYGTTEPSGGSDGDIYFQYGS